MKIGVIGGGPAGLYFAILMKAADASHEVDVYERNAPDDTFGWGVVFSDSTLGILEVVRPTHGIAGQGPETSKAKQADRADGGSSVPERHVSLHASDRVPTFARR